MCGGNQTLPDAGQNLYMHEYPPGSIPRCENGSVAASYESTSKMDGPLRFRKFIPLSGKHSRFSPSYRCQTRNPKSPFCQRSALIPIEKHSSKDGCCCALVIVGHRFICRPLIHPSIEWQATVEFPHHTNILPLCGCGASIACQLTSRTSSRAGALPRIPAEMPLPGEMMVIRGVEDKIETKNHKIPKAGSYGCPETCAPIFRMHPYIQKGTLKCALRRCELSQYIFRTLVQPFRMKYKGHSIWRGVAIWLPGARWGEVIDL